MSKSKSIHPARRSAPSILSTITIDTARECQNCEHWLRNPLVRDGDGACRRFPPFLDNQLNSHTFRGYRFPMTLETNSCGEFKYAANLPKKKGKK